MQVFYFGVADGARTHDNWNHNPGQAVCSAIGQFLTTKTSLPMAVVTTRRQRLKAHRVPVMPRV